MNIIVGLGNPGSRYARTRHNVGFLCVEHFARLHHIAFSSRRQHALVASGEVEGVPVALAKPRTFMNQSGQAIAYLLQRFHVSPQDLVIVYDDLDLPPGQVRIRRQGSSGGHRGMESIIQAAGSQEIHRIRVGIGRPLDQGEVDYVLSSFGHQEEPLVQQAIVRVSDALLCILTQGLDQAMNRYNTREASK